MRKARKAIPRKKATKTKAVRARAKAWTATEVARLRQLYKTETSTKIAKTLRRSQAAVAAKARALGLRKPKSWKPPTAKKKATVKRKLVRKPATRRKARRR